MPLELFICIIYLFQASDESAMSSTSRMATRNSPRKGPPQPLTNLTAPCTRRQKGTPKIADTVDISLLNYFIYVLNLLMVIILFIITQKASFAIFKGLKFCNEIYINK